ncbi:uncharacterized protein APUU_11812S [Aspergillus puulaauensis]|uniref:Cell cycle inhibitor Nif1 n=1 Tax=Aspergillus puulaauensis TaxID=1220207 RepID=A0A7R8AGT8_9EURO|nr:uncharacterized protein APUU_11812S [Aspergillus puulaauensis]BCS18984.1 hypothetical protein APUU_11812S [Aspergillus puulaauensis]
MAHRPQYNTRSPSNDAIRGGAVSPRIEHFDGEVPPALSPLDAFAFQGRLLARQLEDSARRDRRLSRLPPSSVARSLSQGRPGYFRSQSSSDASRSGAGTALTRQPTQKNYPEPEEPRFRPQSEHPRLSSISHISSENNYSGGDDATPKNESPTADNEGFRFDAARAESPEYDNTLRASSEGPRRFYAASPVGHALPAPQKTSSTDSASSRLNIPRSLAPPGSPLSRPSSSSRGPQTESSDDDYSSSNAGSTFSNQRKLSSSSAMSTPYSPMASMARSHPRSPSISSEASNSSHLPRPSFNFSRPLSRSSTSLSAPIGLGVSEQPPCNMQGAMNRSSKPSPIVLPGGSSDMLSTPTDDPSSSVSSYIYAKYALPRGRGVPRDSVVFSGLQTPHFEWQEPLFESPEQRPRTAEPQRTVRTPSISPSRPENTQKRLSAHEPTVPDDRLLTPVVSASSAHTTPLPEKPEPESASARARSSETARTDDISETTSSADSASTLRPQTAKTAATSAVISAEEHVAKGIELHEKGSLNESTYHLRIAAKQDHPVAMLLYALACRHGWGMRPNQREGVRWLRKAMDSVGLELSGGDSDSVVSAKAKELQKAYRAQFALSVYELGVSHLNGWGIEQDKPLALRCFETAGRWGDVDALAEAGYCYAEGVGCKKDLKKAAKFYREAEAKGMSMVGNSWIYKAKYMSDDGPETRSRGRQANTPEKKGRSKSRTRSLFQRKKAHPAEA